MNPFCVATSAFCLFAVKSLAADQIDTGTDLLDHVNASIQFIENEDKSTTANLIKITRLSGFIKGVVQMEGVARAQHKEQRRFRIPDNANTTQLVYVIERYLKAHPENLHQLAVAHVLLAFTEAFPP